MNYMLEIKAFYDLQEINQLSSGQIALWFALMHINNKVGWMQEFTVSNQTLQSKSGLSRNGVNQARNVLKQKGYIRFTESNNRKATKYGMLTLLKSSQDYVQDYSQDSGHVYSQDCSQDYGHTCGALNKQDKTKQNINKKTYKKSPFTAHTENAALLDTLKAFEEHRKQLKKPMTDHAKELLLKKLNELAAPFSDKDRYKVEALNGAIAKGWLMPYALEGFRDSPYVLSQGEFIHDPEDHPTLLKPGMSVEDLI